MSPYMDDDLTLPLHSALERMQRRIMTETTYFGVKTLKNPLDFWIYQEIIYETRPDFVIEIGNKFGGSTLALAHILDLLGHGHVVGIDVDHSQVSELAIEHPRITLIEGDACQVFGEVKKFVASTDDVLVIEDSSHTFENTLSVLNTYSSLVKSGNYFIVEDSICHHGLDVGPTPGPYEAIEAFIEGGTRFFSDREKERFGVTWNPKGYLRCK